MNMKRHNSNVSDGQNWPVFDFCNQFLQTEEALEEAVWVGTYVTCRPCTYGSGGTPESDLHT